MVMHCLDRVFECVALDEQNPCPLALMDASAFIQTFVINIYGAIDNLAHVWCSEASVCDAKGQPLTPNLIGFTPKNKLVRSSLPLDLRDYLAAHDAWFGYLEGYRHALAHRIPLYIPPRQLGPAAQAELQELETQKAAAFALHDWQRIDRLNGAINRLGYFEPYIMHSFREQAIPMRFHAQMICDLATVVELGERFIFALDSIAATLWRQPLTSNIR
jgi:hypothetical protein